jgi:hypothetical protein
MPGEAGVEGWPACFERIAFAPLRLPIARYAPLPALLPVSVALLLDHERMAAVAPPKRAVTHLF